MSFSYSGGNRIAIAGNEYLVVLFDPKLLFAYEYTPDIVGVYSWTHVINLDNERNYCNCRAKGVPVPACKLKVD